VKNLFFLPIGSYEQHGPHLPPNTDYLIAEKVAHTVSIPFQGIIIEGIRIGLSQEHEGFEHTKSISEDEFLLQIQKIFRELQDDAIFILINAHGGNVDALKKIQKWDEKRILVLNIFSLIKGELEAIRTSDLGGICHAGEFETSIMLYLFPELVHLNNLNKTDVNYVPFLDPNYKNERNRDWKTIHYSKSGVLGDPFHADSIKGQLWFNALIKKITTFLKEFIV